MRNENWEKGGFVKLHIHTILTMGASQLDDFAEILEAGASLRWSIRLYTRKIWILYAFQAGNIAEILEA